MIIFHEGLPRSGKSFEAVVRRIIPALAAGRFVDAYIEGLDYAKLAAHAGITEERCRELLHVLTREQVPTIPSIARDNALVVLDEAQNFWGLGGRLPADITQFVTEHGHRGMDIVLMGQSAKDVHPLWRRRIELKLCFLKLTGLGADGHYSVATWRHLGNDKYERVSMSKGKYDSKYFGSYASHVADGINTANYQETRATLWGSATFRYGVPAAVLVAALGGYKVWQFFHPAPPPSARAAAVSHAGASPSAPALPQRLAVPASAPVPASSRQVPAIERYLASLSGNRIRLAGLARMGNRVAGVVEWVSGDTRVIERMTLDTLRSLGVAVVVSGDTVQLATGEWLAFATSWPIEGEIRMSQAKLDEVRSLGSPIVVATGPGGVADQTRDLPGTITLTPSRGAPAAR